jgi:hypothetical protein
MFYVEQYLLAFILGDTYMEENYYGSLKNKIASLFDVTEKHIVWRDNTNLRQVSSQRLEEVQREIKNKGYWKFHDEENARELKELEMYMRKNDAYQALSKKKPYIYKIDDKYYVVGYFIFEECKNRELCDKYDQLIAVVQDLENELGKEIKEEILDAKDLRLFIPMFDSIREYCDEQERKFREEWSLKDQLGENISIEKGVKRMVDSMFSELKDAQIEQLSAQVVDFGWLSDQSIRFEVLKIGLKNNE